MFNTRFKYLYYYLPQESQYSNDDFVNKLQTEFPSLIVHFGLPQHRHLTEGGKYPKVCLAAAQSICRKSALKQIRFALLKSAKMLFLF
jgi:hypothetical protein